jgi:L-fuculose-phosphate aldolase
MASVHCHPPYATAFAVAGVEPPTCMIPEFEVFCAVPSRRIERRARPEMGQLVADLVDKHNTILMANHGVVTWSHNNVEEAYWRMEIIEAYCRTLMVASSSANRSRPSRPINCRICSKSSRTSASSIPVTASRNVSCATTTNGGRASYVAAPQPTSPRRPRPEPHSEAEAVVQAVTNQIMARLGKSL